MSLKGSAAALARNGGGLLHKIFTVGQDSAIPKAVRGLSGLFRPSPLVSIHDISDPTSSYVLPP